MQIRKATKFCKNYTLTEISPTLLELFNFVHAISVISANLTPSFIYFLSTLLASALFIILIKNFLTADHSPKKNDSPDADKEAAIKELEEAARKVA